MGMDVFVSDLTLQGFSRVVGISEGLGRLKETS